ncbi:MAG: triose-phosphate isomerase [Bacteroidales bacterium]|jgi:triosephosphate isomerase|nr:triose-phosphate isomerase [Bacteroidales bacterium]
MRKNIIAGNWKMNKTLAEGVQLAKDIKAAVDAAGSIQCDVVVAPPFLHLTEVSKVVGSKIGVSAQNCAAEASGAYTGEVSAAMIKSAGVNYVIIGHSERRTYYGETDAILAKKVKLALENQLTPIFCVGEELAQRDSGKHFETVYGQLKDGLFDLSADDFKKIVIAYEPVWAIGTGRTATPEQAQEVHAFIRKSITEKYGEEVAKGITIQYGGSMNENNAKELLACPDIDGGLIGGASLVAEKFIKIITSF